MRQDICLFLRTYERGRVEGELEERTYRPLAILRQINFRKANICEESWAPKNWCFWTVVLEKTLESPLDCKEIQPVHSKGDQSWVFIGRTDAKAETLVLWPPHAKSWLIGKYSDSGRDWGQEEKGMTEDEMAGWHHRLSGHEFEWTPGIGDGQGGLACCDSWVAKSRTWLSNWTELNWTGRRIKKPFVMYISLGRTKNLLRGCSVVSCILLLFCFFFFLSFP